MCYVASPKDTCHQVKLDMHAWPPLQGIHVAPLPKQGWKATHGVWMDDRWIINPTTAVVGMDEKRGIEFTCITKATNLQF